MMTYEFIATVVVVYIMKDIAENLIKMLGRYLKKTFELYEERKDKTEQYNRKIESLLESIENLERHNRSLPQNTAKQIMEIIKTVVNNNFDDNGYIHNTHEFSREALIVLQNIETLIKNDTNFKETKQ